MVEAIFVGSIGASISAIVQEAPFLQLPTEFVRLLGGDAFLNEFSSSISSVRFLSGFALVIVGLLLFVALSSFFITGGADRSIFDMPVSELFTNVDIEVDNPLGRFGAWVADLLVTNGVGVMALLLPWLIAVMGLNVIVRGLFNIRRQIIFCACAACIIYNMFQR